MSEWVSQWVRIFLWRRFRKNYYTYPFQTFTHHLDGYSQELIRFAVSTNPIWPTGGHFVENHVFQHYSLTIADSLITCRTKVVQFCFYFHLGWSDLDSNKKWPTGSHFVFQKSRFQPIHLCLHSFTHNPACILIGRKWHACWKSLISVW